MTFGELLIGTQILVVLLARYLVSSCYNVLVKGIQSKIAVGVVPYCKPVRAEPPIEGSVFFGASSTESSWNLPGIKPKTLSRLLNKKHLDQFRSRCSISNLSTLLDEEPKIAAPQNRGAAISIACLALNHTSGRH